MKSRPAGSLLGLTVAATLFGQPAQWSGPVSGLVFDQQSRSLRWIVGAPGAAYLGGSAAEGLDVASVSPDGKLAVGIKDGELGLIRLGGESAVWEPLEAAAGTVERIVWNAESSAVAAAGGSVRVWRNLNRAPEPAAQVGVDGAKWVALAVDAAADCVLAARAGGVYRLSSGEARLVADVADPAGIAIAGEVAYIADRAGKQVLAMRNWKESAEVWRVAGEAGGIDDPVAVGTDLEGRRLLVAGGSSRSLLQLDASTGELQQRWDLDFAPSRVERLSSGLVALTSRAAQEPLQVLSAGPRASVFFVPDGAALSAAGPRD